MTLQNQIEYLQKVYNIDMFNDCNVPDGLNMSLVRGAIVMRCGLMTPLFSEPGTQKAATQQFFHENQWNFEQLVKVLQAEYNPVENVFEDTIETDGINNIHDIEGVNNESGENKISAENVTTYSPDRKQETTGTEQRRIIENDSRVNEKHRHGNIGVTSAQKLIGESIDLVNRFNPYRTIADLYEKELILGLY